MIEAPNTVHGRLLEAVHITGYTMERACSELEWLLDEDRWKTVGSGFDNIKGFLSTINLSEFRFDTDRRIKIAKRLKELQAPQAATAKMLGVDQKTVSNDLRKENSSSASDNAKESDSFVEQNEENSSLPFTQSAEEVMDAAKKSAKQKDRKKKKNKKRAENIATMQRKVAMPDAKYDVIVMDPPWPMEKIERDVRPNQTEFDYPTMTEDEMVEFGQQVLECAEDTCHLFMWTTQKFLPMSLRLVEAYGFEYCLTMVWRKSR